MAKCIGGKKEKPTVSEAVGLNFLTDRQSPGTFVAVTLYFYICFFFGVSVK
jgi:hypothetical protein